MTAAIATRLLETRALRPGTFTVDGREYRYLWHDESRSWRGERAVELPIAIDELVGTVLEVGNVLARYCNHEHTVVDKYEQAPGVINEDVVTFDGGPYDRIIAISTLEHVGYDEDPRDPAKAGRAIERLRGMLAPGGRLLVTVPVGYNRDYDDFIFASDAELACLRRVGQREWRQVDAGEARIPYGWPYPGANAVAFATWTA